MGQCSGKLVSEIQNYDFRVGLEVILDNTFIGKIVSREKKRDVVNESFVTTIRLNNGTMMVETDDEQIQPIDQWLENRNMEPYVLNNEEHDKSKFWKKMMLKYEEKNSNWKTFVDFFRFTVFDNFMSFPLQPVKSLKPV